ncbi:MFS transporter [Candidatus Saccharibacteria bacterium]|nr:MFS transporter [Candidatus Saccharibacteria bacterium]
MHVSLLGSLRLLRAEAILTSALFAMPVLNGFFAEIGMSQAEIGLSQAAFTLGLFVLNVPTGWLADRFSRKWCNAIGDLIAGLAVLYYAGVDGFVGVVIAEVLMGAGLAFSQGADTALLRSYSLRLGRSHQVEASRIATFKPWMQAAAVLAGGIIGAEEPRLALVVSAIPFLLGSLLSMLLMESGERRRTEHHPLKDMGLIVRYALHGHPRLGWAIAASAVAKEITHAIIWVLTPLLLLAGVPLALVGAGWALNLAAGSLGGFLAGRRRVLAMPAWQLFVLPALLCLVALVVLSVHVSALTIGLYAIFGLSRGWYEAVMPPMVQSRTPGTMQSTVSSVAGSVSQLLYMPVVSLVNLAGNHGPQWTMAANAAIFAPLVVLIAVRLKRLNGG